MSNTFLTNTFTGGLNLDTDITLVPNDLYGHAENVRVITNDDGNTGVLQNIQGVIELECNTQIGKYETVIATCVIDKYGIILTVDKDSITRIYRVDNYNNPPLQLTVLVKGNLGITKDSKVKIIGNYESDENIKIYFVDGINPLRTLNILEERYSPDNTNSSFVDNVGNLRDPNVLNATPGALLEPPTFIGFGSGSLKSGKVLYCYELFNIRGSSTVISPCSGLIHLTESNTNEWSKDYEGVEKDTTTNKSVKILFTLLSTVNGINYVDLYDACRVYRISYNDNTELGTVTIVGEILMNKDNKTVLFEDNGSNEISTITIDEFNAIQNYLFIPNTIESKDNRLFVANVRLNEWDVDYDARAYRCNKNGKLVLLSLSGDTIELTLPSYGSDDEKVILSQIPEHHDCINPYNASVGTVTEDEDYEYSNYKVAGIRVLGGSGINVSYRFVYNTIGLDRMGNISLSGEAKRNNEFADINIAPVTTSQFEFRYLDTPQYMTTEDIPVDMPILPNYSDPYIDLRTTGYLRDEIYRFGIVLYNSEGVSSPVHWIGDIRMPHPYKYIPFYAGDNLEGRCLGLEFKVKNLPNDVVAYDIVRCNRTTNDRTVVMQGVLSSIVKYDYKYLNDDLDTDTQHFPIVPLTYTNSDYAWIHVRNNLFSLSLERWSALHVDKINKKLNILISPEIDYMGDSILDKMNGVFIEPIYWLHGQSYRDDYISLDVLHQLFIVPIKTNYAHTTELYNNGYALGAYDQSKGAFIMAQEGLSGGNSSDGSIHSVTNFISKKYIPHTSGLTERLLYAISSDSIYPTLLSKNAILHKSSYYTQIGGVNYLNLGISLNHLETYDEAITRSGYFGSCLIINGEELLNIPRSSNTFIEGSKINCNNTILNRVTVSSYIPQVFDIPVVNIKRRITPYGGNSHYIRTNSTYISTNSYTRVTDAENSSIVFGGDTYLGILDHRTCCPWPDINDEVHYDESLGALLLSCTDYIPFETSINLLMNYGENTSRTGDINYTNVWLGTTLDQGNIGTLNIQTKPYYAYNDVYSVLNKTKLFVSKGAYDLTNLNTNNRIMYSQLKTNNEIDDSWLKFNVADYLDVDSKYGSLTNMLTYGGRLYFWQDGSFGVAAVNDRSLITDNNINTLTLGTGGVLTRYDYITTNNGNARVNDNSIATSDSGIYWYDVYKNEICQFSNALHKLSKEKNIQTLLNNNPKMEVNTTVYDFKFNELLMCFTNYNIVYNEFLLRYTSFYTYIPDKALLFKDRILYIKDNKFTINSNNSLDTILSKITYIINKDLLYTKTYDNVFFSGVFTDIKSILTDAKYTTKSLIGTILQDYLVGGYAIDYREDTYRFAISREDKQEDNTTYAGRLKGKYLICDYTFKCDKDNYFNLPNINTTYRYSLV